MGTEDEIAPDGPGLVALGIKHLSELSVTHWQAQAQVEVVTYGYHTGTLSQPVPFLPLQSVVPLHTRHLHFMTAPTPYQWYRLTNAFTGPDVALDVVNDNGTSSSGTLQMSPSGNFSGQYWQLIPYPSPSSTTYALFTLFLGANKRLDVYGDDATKPHLADAGDYSGQIWTISPWGDGTWQLWNQFSGSTLHLDTYSDTKVPFMGDGDHTGQHWTFTSLQGAPPSSTQETDPSGILSSSSSSTTNTSSNASTMMNAIIGGAAGGAVALIVFLCLIAFLLHRNRKRKQITFAPEKKVPFPDLETEFPTVSGSNESNRLPNAMTTSSIVSSTSPTSPTGIHTTPLFTAVPASPVTTTPPYSSAEENPRKNQYHILEPELPDSTTPCQPTPSILSSTSSRLLGDQHLSDNQAAFLAELLRQGVSASDVPRILEHMGDDDQGPHNEISMDSNQPPAYDFKN